jgi:hypothetical protein
MDVENRGDDHLLAHPLLSRLLEVGTGVRAFRGYVGPDKDGVRMRLYPSLGDLAFFVEFNKDDIVASTAAPESLLPHGGTVVWLKPDADVVCHGDRINTIAARRPYQAGRSDGSLAHVSDKAAAAGGLVHVQTGRLSIRVRSRVMSTCASCSCASCETNPSCTSQCNEKLLTPSVVIGP